MCLTFRSTLAKIQNIYKVTYFLRNAHCYVFGRPESQQRVVFVVMSLLLCLCCYVFVCYVFVCYVFVRYAFFLFLFGPRPLGLLICRLGGVSDFMIYLPPRLVNFATQNYELFMETGIRFTIEKKQVDETHEIYCSCCG